MAKNGLATLTDDNQVPIATGATPTPAGTDLCVSHGGVKTAVLAAGAGTVVVKASPGRLCKVVVTAAGTATDNITIYDNASAASGTVLAVIAGGGTVGTVYDLQMPAANGIFASNVASGPAVTISYL